MTTANTFRANWPFVLIAAIFLGTALVGVLTGRIWLQMRTLTRTNDKVMYWATIWCSVIMAGFMLLVAAHYAPVINLIKEL